MTSNPIDGFRDAIAAAGMTAPDTIEADAKLHRFSSNGKTGDDAGWCVLHSDGHFRPPSLGSARTPVQKVPAGMPWHA